MIKTYMFILVIFLVTIPLYAQESLLLRDEPVPESTPILMAPLRTGGNNLFHSLILIPPLESAERIATGKGYLQSGLDYATGNFTKDKSDWLFDYDANLIEAFVDFRYSFSKRSEVKLSLTGGVLAEDERELRLLKNNTGYLAGERHLGLSDLLLGIKFHLMESSGQEEEFPYTSALGIWLKKPLADKENVLSSGGTDLAIAYIETDKIDVDLYVHTQIGYTFVGEENVFREDVEISDTLFYGVGVSQYFENLVLVGQIQGNLNAFEEIKALNKHPLSVQGGFRYSKDGRFFTEGSIGFGLNDESADFTMMLSLGKVF